MSDVPPALVAQVDQEFAEMNRRLDLLLNGTRILIRDNGPAAAWTVSGNYLTDLDSVHVRMMLAAALVRLARQEN
jgi:hypothetical protein